MSPPTPAKKLAVITCMDARLDVGRILGLEEGDAHVIRNAGARVTDDVLRSLEASRALGTERLVFMVHTDCGARGSDVEAEARAELPQLPAGTKCFVYDVDTRELRELS